MDSENMAYLWAILNTMYKNTCFVYVIETSPWEVSFTHTKHMFDRKKLSKIIFGGFVLFCLPPYHSNFR